MVPYGRKSGTERLKEKPKFRVPSRSIKFYGHVPRVKFAMKLQLAFKSTKKSAVQPLHSFLFTKWGKFVQNARFLKVF